MLFGHGKPANSLFPPQVPYYDPNTPGHQFNLAQAKKEMAKSIGAARVQHLDRDPVR